MALNSSVMSFPERGKWGRASWRGNASGYVYKKIFEQLHPRVFVDPMVGSGTSIEVAKEMGIEGIGLDLHQGFDAVNHSILKAVGKEADLCLSHPPYGTMIRYSGSVWGTEPDPRDLSHHDDEEFHSMLQCVMLNQREATKPGFYYGCLIGDLRRNGRYTSYQAEVIARMPRDELAAVLIKMQHGCTSDRKAYGAMQLPRIEHEYLCLFKRKAMPVLVMLSGLARDQQARLKSTWRNIVRVVLQGLGGSAPLAEIYQRVAADAPERLAANPHWQDKVRQVLNSNPSDFKSAGRGSWALA